MIKRGLKLGDGHSLGCSVICLKYHRPNIKEYESKPGHCCFSTENGLTHSMAGAGRPTGSVDGAPGRWAEGWGDTGTGKVQEIGSPGLRAR